MNISGVKKAGMRSAQIAVAAALMSGLAAPAGAQEAFLGQAYWMASTYCPRGFAEANGQILPISQNQALFSLLGTTFGGDGQTTFALPDLRARAPVNVGQGPGLSSYVLGQTAGAETTTLAAAQLPAHTHSASTTITMKASSAPASSASPTGNVLANGRTNRLYAPAAASLSLGATSISAAASTGSAGGGQPFNNMQPSLALRACIALQGIFPSRD